MSTLTGTTAARLVRLFVVSYMPLAVMAALRLSEDPGEVSAAAIVFWIAVVWAIWGGIDAFRLPRGALKKGAINAQFHDIEDQGGAVAAYLATYLLPFIGFSVNGWRDAATLGVYFGVLLVVFVRSDLALVNPTLYITGWRVLAATRTTEDLNELRVLVLVPRNMDMLPGKDYRVVTFGEFLVMKS